MFMQIKESGSRSYMVWIRGNDSASRNILVSAQQLKSVGTSGIFLSLLVHWLKYMYYEMLRNLTRSVVQRLNITRNPECWITLELTELLANSRIGLVHASM